MNKKNYLKLLTLASALLFGAMSVNAQKVLLDAHSDAAGATTWNITTTHPHELILIAADGYGSTLSNTAGTVTVNTANATFIANEYNPNAGTWTVSVWAFVAPTVGTYSLACTESGLTNPFYFNYAVSVYDPNAALGIGNIIVGGVDSNNGMSTISASITTTVNNSFVFGTANYNDNGGTGTLNWTGLTELDHDYISDGVDCAQADSTYAVAGTYSITCTDIGASNPYAAIMLVAVQPTQCSFSAVATVDSNVNGCGGMGVVNAAITGGVSPFTYSWSSAQTTDTINGLSAGKYIVTVMDSIGCLAMDSANVSSVAPLSVAIDSIILANCQDSLWGVISGGTPPYSVKWSPGNQTKDTIGHLCSGTYKIVVTDANGCKDSASLYAITGVDELNGLDQHVKLYPNPFTKNVNVEVSTNRPVTASMFNMLGEEVGTWTLNVGHNSINTESYPSGVYMLRIKTIDGKVLNKEVIKINE